MLDSASNRMVKRVVKTQVSVPIKEAADTEVRQWYEHCRQMISKHLESVASIVASWDNSLALEAMLLETGELGDKNEKAICSWDGVIEKSAPLLRRDFKSTLGELGWEKPFNRLTIGQLLNVDTKATMHKAITKEFLLSRCCSFTTEECKFLQSLNLVDKHGNQLGKEAYTRAAKYFKKIVYGNEPKKSIMKLRSARGGYRLDEFRAIVTMHGRRLEDLTAFQLGELNVNLYRQLIDDYLDYHVEQWYIRGNELREELKTRGIDVPYIEPTWK